MRTGDGLRLAELHFVAARGCRLVRMSAARWSAQDAEKRADRQRRAVLEPWLEFLPAPAVHANLAAFTALSLANEDRAA